MLGRFLISFYPSPLVYQVNQARVGEGPRDEEAPSKGTRIEDWSAKIDTLFMTKMAAKWFNG